MQGERELGLGPRPISAPERGRQTDHDLKHDRRVSRRVFRPDITYWSDWCMAFEILIFEVVLTRGQSSVKTRKPCTYGICNMP